MPEKWGESKENRALYELAGSSSYRGSTVVIPNTGH